MGRPSRNGAFSVSNMDDYIQDAKIAQRLRSYERKRIKSVFYDMLMRREFLLTMSLLENDWMSRG